MASVSGKVPPKPKDDVKSPPSSSKGKLPAGKKGVEQVETLQSTKKDEQKKEPVEEQKQPSPSTPVEPEGEPQSNNPPSTASDVQEKNATSVSSEDIDKEKIDNKSQEEKSTTSNSQEEQPTTSKSQEETSTTSKPQEEQPTTSKSQEDQPTTSKSQEEKSKTSKPQEELSTTSKSPEEKSTTSKSQEEKSTTSKPRSVNFAPIEDDTEVPKSRSASSTKTRSNYSSKSSYRPVDFVDALVESYKLETSNTSPIREEKKYVPKTNRTRLNPNWREHRTRRLMNKLEELSLWDREEELKAAQAQSLREQKWEQIQDRQRNHDLCLNLMRQRHESEMESAVLLDRAANSINDENTSATISRAMNLATPAEILAYDLPLPPATLKRRARQEQEKPTEFKTPIGRYRQFETNMNNKVDKINQKLQPDREIMRAYSPYNTAIPPTAVPLFSETYAALLSVPDPYASNKYNQYHYGVASYLHQPQHSASPDYETRLRSYSNRDVRVPLKEQANDYSYYDNDSTDEYNRTNPIDDDYYPKYRLKPADNDFHSKYRSNPIDDDYHPKYRSNLIDDDYHSKYRSAPIDDDYHPKHRSNPPDDDYYTKYRSTLSSRLDYSPPRRTTSVASPTASALYDYSTVANTPREYSFIHSRPPASTSIHMRSLNDDLNAITRYSTETSRKILQNIGDIPNDLSTKTRSSTSTKKHVNLNDEDVDDDSRYNNSSRNYSSKTMHQPVEIISLSSTR